MKRRALWWTFAVASCLLVIAGGAAWWFVASEGALQWSLTRIQAMLGEKLVLEGARGSLWNGIAADRIVYEDEKIRVEVNGLEARAGMDEGLRGHLYFDVLRAEKVIVLMKPQLDEPLEMPEHLRLPIDLSIPRAELKELEIERDATRVRFHHIVLQYAATSDLHGIESVQAQSDYGALSFAGRIASTRPFDLSAQLRWLQPQRSEGVFNANGSLAQLGATLQAQLAGAQFDAQAMLRPFEAQPLRNLNAAGKDIDLHAINADLPQSKLSFSIDANSENDLSGGFEANNALPGPIDAGKIPVGRIAGQFETDFKIAKLSSLEIDLGAGGKLSGQARGDMREGLVQLQSRGLNLQGLYSTMRDTALNGPIELAYDLEGQSAKANLSQGDMRFEATATRRGTRIDIARFEARARGGSLNAQGYLDLDETRNFKADLKLSRFDPSQFGTFPQGLVNGTGNIEGALNPLRAQARWTIANSHLNALPLFSNGRFRLIDEQLSDVAINARWGDAQLQA
ncbi:MAG TPA: hypothetical protein VJM53_04565, partial [Burkholderiales bacterium]|nr:hypothetical protein [Burkholderiales bacterium]